MAEIKQRHGWLTAWLIFMIIANSVAMLSLLIAVIPSRNAPLWTMLTSTQRYLTVANFVVASANVVFSVALFQWKKWGFFGFVGTNVFVMAIALTMAKPIGRVLLPVLWVVILYWLLQIGKEKKGWTQLE